MASQGNKGIIELAAAITAQDQKVASLHRIMDAMPRTGSRYAPLVEQAEIALVLVGASGPARATDLSAFIATGNCNALHRLEVERAAILADPDFGLGGVIDKLRANSRSFLAALAICEAGAAKR